VVGEVCEEAVEADDLVDVVVELTSWSEQLPVATPRTGAVESSTSQSVSPSGQHRFLVLVPPSPGVAKTTHVRPGPQNKASLLPPQQLERESMQISRQGVRSNGHPSPLPTVQTAPLAAWRSKSPEGLEAWAVAARMERRNLSIVLLIPS
jgi:hypothetical protein